MANCITKVLAGAAGATVDFDLTQHLGSVIMVSCASSDTAGNNILRFYDVSPAGVFTILGSAAAFATTMQGPYLIAATASTPAYARFVTGTGGLGAPAGTGETAATLKVIGAYFIS